MLENSDPGLFLVTTVDEGTLLHAMPFSAGNCVCIIFCAALITFNLTISHPELCINFEMTD